MKVMAFLTKRHDIEMDALIAHYEQHHVPLILSLAPPPLRYTRDYIRTTEGASTATRFDIVTELTFEDEPTYRAWVTTMYTPGSGVAEDEATFLDRDRTFSYVVEEHHETEPTDRSRGDRT